MPPVERRRHKRHDVKVDAIVSHHGRMGKIKNISMGGLMCRCIGNSRPSLGSCVFDIYCATNGFRFALRKIPSTIIAEHLDSDETCTTNSLRLCSVKFDQLSPGHEEQLQDFIVNQAQHTKDFDPPSRN
jgi:c-di-GMP-binding flagellar brake protein YcgR